MSLYVGEIDNFGLSCADLLFLRLSDSGIPLNLSLISCKDCKQRRAHFALCPALAGSHWK